MGYFLDMDDGEVSYVQKGRGMPVIMIHFYGGNSWWYCRILSRFAQQYDVYVLDLPGNGRSDTPPLPYTVPDMADAVREFMNRLRIEKAHLLGIGGGAMTLVHVASCRPSRVAKLVLEVLPHWTRAEGKGCGWTSSATCWTRTSCPSPRHSGPRISFKHSPG